MTWLLQLPFIKEISVLIVGVLALLGWGKMKERQGRKELEAKLATENLEEFKDASAKHKDVRHPVDAAAARDGVRKFTDRRKRKS